MTRLRTSLFVASILLTFSMAHADFLQTFDSGSATYTSDPGWMGGANCNGYIIQNTNSPAVCGGGFGNSIPNDVSGTGYFLMIGTSAVGSGNEFFISPTFSVTANTDYDVSFYLNNADGANIGSIEAEIDGTTFSPVSASGTGEWEQFTFTWNSGSNTTASVILHDLQTNAVGNDFGVDDICVAESCSSSSSGSVPEPATLSLLGSVVLAALARRRTTP